MQLQFIGAAEEVTGACFLLRFGERNILIDCGLIQGSPADEARNREPFSFEPSEIDAVILSHAHIDHSGRLPQLIKAGYRGPIYAHRASRDLCRIMLRDAGFLNTKDAEWENKKRARKGLTLIEPIYTAEDAKLTMPYFKVLNYDQPKQILPGVRLNLLDAGHILGSSIVEVIFSDKGNETKLVYSGDLGQVGAPILRDPTIVNETDILLLESTYGDRCHRGYKETLDEFTEILSTADQSRGNILIPAFAVGRTQELLYLMAKHYDEWNMSRWQIFLDSPLAIDATRVYEKNFRLYDAEASQFYGSRGFKELLPNLHFTRTSNQSMQLNRIRSGAIIIAGSGMCTGGRIRHHLKHNVWRNNCHVVIVGYQAHGTIGRALVDGARHIRLWGETINVEADIHTIGGFSAHADQASLLRWFSEIRTSPRVYLVHGESGALQSFKQSLTESYTAEVNIAKRLETIHF